jgi:hypothetical protein
VRVPFHLRTTTLSNFALAHFRLFWTFCFQKLNISSAYFDYSTKPATPSIHSKQIKMRRYYIVSGILLIVPIALAVPVLVQEKHQAVVDVVHIPEDAITMLGKRGTGSDEWLKYLSHFDNHFAKPEEESAAARPSSSSPPSGPDHEWTDVEQPPPSPVSSPYHTPPESLTGSESEYELVGDGEDAPPRTGPSTQSDHESTGVYAPPSSQVFPTWFHPDAGSIGAHAPQPNLGPSNIWPSTEFDSDHRHVVEEPPSRPASPTESDDEMVDVPPSSSVSSIYPDRRSMGADSLLEADGDALKGNAKESRRISGTTRDVLNAAQRELQREKPLNTGE